MWWEARWLLRRDENKRVCVYACHMVAAIYSYHWASEVTYVQEASLSLLRTCKHRLSLFYLLPSGYLPFSFQGVPCSAVRIDLWHSYCTIGCSKTKKNTFPETQRGSKPVPRLYWESHLAKLQNIDSSTEITLFFITVIMTFFPSYKQ